MDGIFFKLKDIRKLDPYKEESVLSRRLNSTIENGRFIAVRKSGDRYAPFYRKVARAVTRGVFRASICDDEIFRSVFRICVSFLRCFASFQPRYSPRNGMQFPRIRDPFCCHEEVTSQENPRYVPFRISWSRQIFPRLFLSPWFL